MTVPDISRTDNESLARSARDLCQALTQVGQLNLHSPLLTRQALRMVFKFAGEPQPESVLDEIARELRHVSHEPKDTSTRRSSRIEKDRCTNRSCIATG